MKRQAAVAGKVIVAGLVLVGSVLGACLVLTDPKPATLPRRIGQWLTTPRPAEATSAAPAPALVEADVPPFSEVDFDDSGYGPAFAFTDPIQDPESLREMRDSVIGRNRRGIALLEGKLAALRPGDPATPHFTAQMNLLIGALWMYEGGWKQAGEHFARAQVADPEQPALSRANLEALRGVAELRRGEIENCVACCNESSCIVPLAAAAIHRQPSGSRAAIEHFTRYLKQRPEDLGAKWLLNVAHMTLGGYPDRVPPEFLLPLGRLAPPAGGSPLRMTNVAARAGLNRRGESMSGACLVDDFDGDGRVDVFMPTTDATKGAALLHNKGDGTFADVSAAAGLDEQSLSLNAVHADYDNDGDLDILVLRGAWESPRRMSLLRNRGDGTFDDVTLAARLGDPIATQGAAWADYDNDGWVDLYVAGEFKVDHPDDRNRGRLYHNERDGTFAEVGRAAGVTNDRFGKGVAWGDYDGDGRPDLYVSNRQEPNRLYHNEGDGKFADVTTTLGVAEPLRSFACWFFDYDNDGRLDLWVCPNGATLSDVVRDQLGRPTGGERPRLYRNVGGDRPFRDATAEAGLDRVVLPMGSNFGDVDNDGFLDIYLGTGRPAYSYLMPNVMFRNVEGRRFEDVTAATGTGHLQKGHGVAWADYDRDGDAEHGAGRVELLDDAVGVGHQPAAEVGEA